MPSFWFADEGVAARQLGWETNCLRHTNKACVSGQLRGIASKKRVCAIDPISADTECRHSLPLPKARQIIHKSEYCRSGDRPQTEPTVRYRPGSAPDCSCRNRAWRQLECRMQRAHQPVSEWQFQGRSGGAVHLVRFLRLSPCLLSGLAWCVDHGCWRLRVRCFLPVVRAPERPAADIRAWHVQHLGADVPVPGN